MLTDHTWTAGFNYHRRSISILPARAKDGVGGPEGLAHVRLGGAEVHPDSFFSSVRHLYSDSLGLLSTRMLCGFLNDVCETDLI